MVFGYVNLWSSFGTKRSDYGTYQSYSSTRASCNGPYAVYGSRFTLRIVTSFKSRRETTVRSYGGTNVTTRGGSYCQS